ncbi:MAG: hypothetical protein AAF804_09440 [Bacteroidota bacterium]
MPFDFNLYSSLLLPLVIQGIIFSIILLVRGLREDRLADRLLALLIFLLTLRPMNWMLGFAGWYDSHDAFTTFIFYFPWNWFLLLGPLTYFYFQSLTNQDFRWQKRDWLFFVPTLLAKFIKLSNFGFDVIWEHQVKGKPFPFHFETRGAMDLFSGLGNVLDWVSPFWLLGFLGYTLWQYQRYRRYVAENFSDLAPLDFTWLRNFLVAFSLLQLIYYGFQVADSLSGEGLSYIQNWYSFFAWGLIIYYLSIAGLLANAKEHYFLKYHPSSLLSPDSPADPRSEIDPQQKERLEQLMAAEKPYLSPGLSLQ